MQHSETLILVSLIAFIALLLVLRKVFAICDAASEVDWGGKWLNRLDGAMRLFCRHYHRLSSEHIRIPPHGPAIVVANHISGLDPILLAAATKRPLRFLIAKEEYERFGFTWLFRAAGCIPVDRKKNPEQALRTALVALKNGEAIAIFPHGGITTRRKPRLLKGGAVRLAKKTTGVIYPVVVHGIRGKGFTLLAVILRSHARLKEHPPIHCQDEDYDVCMKHMAEVLNINV